MLTLEAAFAEPPTALEQKTSLIATIVNRFIAGYTPHLYWFISPIRCPVAAHDWHVVPLREGKVALMYKSHLEKRKHGLWNRYALCDDAVNAVLLAVCCYTTAAGCYSPALPSKHNPLIQRNPFAIHYGKKQNPLPLDFGFHEFWNYAELNSLSIWDARKEYYWQLRQPTDRTYFCSAEVLNHRFTVMRKYQPVVIQGCAAIREKMRGKNDPFRVDGLIADHRFWKEALYQGMDVFKYLPDCGDINPFVRDCVRCYEELLCVEILDRR